MRQMPGSVESKMYSRQAGHVGRHSHDVAILKPDSETPVITCPDESPARFELLPWMPVTRLPTRLRSSRRDWSSFAIWSSRTSIRWLEIAGSPDCPPTLQDSQDGRNHQAVLDRGITWHRCATFAEAEMVANAGRKRHRARFGTASSDPTFKERSNSSRLSRRHACRDRLIIRRTSPGSLR